MAPIEDPWHSRPIDVHRWSDHPEVAGLTETVWEEYVAFVQKSGPKPKTAFRHQLRVLLLDLYVAWLSDPTLSIGVSMSSNFWDTNSRYNAIHISKKIIPIIQALHENGLLDLARGSYGGADARGNRTTRIRASERLQKMFSDAAFVRDDVGRVANQEIIILRDTEDANLVEYEDTEETNRMRARLGLYNRVISSSFIDIPILDEPMVNDIPTDHHHCLTRRIFSRSDWNMNGRFHGGWWQQINSDWRSKIFINDTPVVEVDFQGLHASILTIENGAELDGDPYDVDQKLMPGVPLVLQRAMVKRLILTAINANSKGAAYRAFRDGYPAGNFAKGISNQELDRLLAAFLRKSPHLEQSLFTDQGIRLMNLDSQIADLVHEHFSIQAIPVLSVHDSFLIDYTRVAQLKEAMAAASKAVVGVSLPTSNVFYGLDEQPDPNADHVRDYIIYRQTARCEGYLKRMQAYERKRGEVVPYRYP
jgi:hypothetical protein